MQAVIMFYQQHDRLKTSVLECN